MEGNLLLGTIQTDSSTDAGMNMAIKIVDGKIILENHEFRNIDADRIYRQAASVAQRVWKTVDKIRS